MRLCIAGGPDRENREPRWCVHGVACPARLVASVGFSGRPSLCGASDGVGVDGREGLASAGFVTTVSVIFLVVCFLIGVFAPR